jgi:16S rRNA (uracil1498-N3)-methyltransferase
MPRFFIRASQIENIDGVACIRIVGDDAHHISYSLRMRVGEVIEVCDMQKNVYSCEISSMDGKEVIAKITKSGKCDTEPPVVIKLYQALAKGDKMETVIQKAVECGVCEIIPFSSERCVVKLDKKDAAKKLERYSKIAESGAKQCGRGIIPTVEKILDYKGMLEDASKSDLVLFCYEGDDTVSVKSVLRANEDVKSISVIVGSEGGFSINEVNMARETGAKIVGLGKRILRCETAPTFVLSCISYELEL